MKVDFLTQLSEHHKIPGGGADRNFCNLGWSLVKHLAGGDSISRGVMNSISLDGRSVVPNIFHRRDSSSWLVV